MRFARLDPGLANAISSLTGAGLVFIASRRRVFRSGDGALAPRLAVYLVWILAQIALASLAVRELAGALEMAGAQFGMSVAAATAAVGAKAAVTPFTLVSNFVVARRLNPARPSPAVRAHV